MLHGPGTGKRPPQAPLRAWLCTIRDAAWLLSYSAPAHHRAPGSQTRLPFGVSGGKELKQGLGASTMHEGSPRVQTCLEPTASPSCPTHTQNSLTAFTSCDPGCLPEAAKLQTFGIA